MPTPKIILAPADEKDIFLASPDILEWVRGQLIDTIDSLSAALEVCVTRDSTNLAFLEAIENYTDQVQAFYDAAELAGLVGLQEVYRFIDDNVIALGSQELTAKRVAQPYFEKWPAAVLDYLQAPVTGSQSLVQMMQDRAWPVPLEEETAHQLLSLLTRSSTTLEPEGGVEALAGEFDDGVEAGGVEAGGVEALAGEEEADQDSDSPGDIGLEVTQEISLGSAEVLGIFIDELESTKEPLAEELQRFTTLNNQEAAFLKAAENYEDLIQRLYAAAEMLGLQSLQDVCTFLIDNVKLLSKRELAARTKAKKVLEAWPDLVLAYLKSPMDSVIPLLNHLRKPQWAQPLADDKAHELLILLTQPVSEEGTIDEEPAYSRPTQAKPEEVSLKIPSDVNRELLAAYLEEVPQHASYFSAIIQRIIRNPQTSDIVQAQRIAYTLKGSSRSLGIVGIANIAHHLEDTLEYLTQHKVVLPKELTNTMVEAADCIEQMVDALMGQGEAPPEALQVLQSVLDWANRIDKGNLQAPPVSSRPAPAAEKPPEATLPPAPDPNQDMGDIIRVPVALIDKLTNLVGELSISRAHLEQQQGTVKNLLSEMEQAMARLRDRDQLRRLEIETEAQILFHYTQILSQLKGTIGIKIDQEEFDPLELDRFSVMKQLSRRLLESIISDLLNIQEALKILTQQADSLLLQQARIGAELHDATRRTRIISFSHISPRFQRIVHLTARQERKPVDFIINGEHIEFERTVLNGLANALEHMLRNAFHHGIEDASTRQQAGKPAIAQITLDISKEGTELIFKLSDDGKGLDLPAIRKDAEEIGMIKPDTVISDDELMQFILEPGFFMNCMNFRRARGITQFSGRGVGMDVVTCEIKKLRGTLHIHSKAGQGTSFEIRLPLSLTIN